MRNIHIALLSAMPSEIGITLDKIENITESKFGDLKIYQGEWKLEHKDFSVFLTIAWSGWGKVSAARTCTRVISMSSSKRPIDLILFTGVAGAINKQLQQWDIVVPDKVIQHDLDARPIFAKYVIPGINIDKIEAPKKWLTWIMESLHKSKNAGKLDQFKGIRSGLIATGDRFISNSDDIEKLSNEINSVEAVEMEGAAIAQVAFQEGIPWIIVRVISDSANEYAAVNFDDFLKLYEKYSWDLIKIILDNSSNAPI